MTKIGLTDLVKIIGLFIVSRILIVITFLLTNSRFEPIPEKAFYWNYSKNAFLNYFGYWDTGWYLYVANAGYINTPLGQGQTNYGFFPFYPLCMKFFGLSFGDNYIGGIVASNFFLLVAATFLFLLCIHIYKQKRTALIAITVLFFFPGSYLLSGVFSEATFVCLTIMSVYYSEKENYFLSGVSGFLATLTRPFGVLLLLPLSFRYFQKNGIRFKKDILYLALIPAGILTFFTYCYLTTGDFMLYVHAKESGWHTEKANVLTILYKGIKHPKDVYYYANTCYTLFILLIVFALYRFIPFYLLVWSILLIAAPLANGNVNLICMPRYILVSFPVMMAVAHFTQKHQVGFFLIFILAAINFILCAFYSLGYQFAA